MYEKDWRLKKARRGGRVSHVLAFDEGVAWDREDLVAGAVKFLETLPGVTEVEHVEREVVGIAAHAVPTGRLAEALRRWWEVAEQEKPPWMAAVDRAADIVSGLTAAHGYRRDGWKLTRVLDAEVSHVISLEHQFGRASGEHSLIVSAYLGLALPDVQHLAVTRYTGRLEADAELADAVTGRMLPALGALSTMDAVLDRWRDERSIAEGGRQRYTGAEPHLHAQVLLSRGRLVEAGHVYQKEFEGAQPRQRAALLELAARHGVPALTTGANRTLQLVQAEGPRLTADEVAERVGQRRVEAGGQTERDRQRGGLVLRRAVPAA